MLTNNWYNLRRQLLKTWSTSNANGYHGIPLVDKAGNSFECSYTDTFAGSAQYNLWNLILARLGYVSSNMTSSSYGGAYFGDGTKEPTLEDCWLSGNWITTLNASSTVDVEELEDGSIVKKAIFTITNTGDSDVTISEIVYMGEVRAGGSSTRQACLDRTLLEEPVTIPVGGVGQVTYTVTINIA